MINLWHSLEDFTIAYRKPHIKVKKGELLFLEDADENVFIFITEAGERILLPRSFESQGKLRDVFNDQQIRT